MSYYEKWYTRLLELLVNSKLVTRDEIAKGKADKGAPKGTPALRADQVAPMFTKGTFVNRHSGGSPARFQIGQRVRARNMHPTGLTRLPRYARGRLGTVEREYGIFSFPDAIAHFQPDKPQHVYSVRFAARELWGEQAKPQDSVYIDMWEDYLEPA
jgi:nitrile hydratase